MKLVLRSSPASPFGRKVKIAAAVLGLSDRIEIVVTDTNDPAGDLPRQNPLGKIPVLVLPDGSALYDSRVIVEYLDDLAGGGIVIPRGEAKFPALRLQALADGICDAALLQVYEGRMRPPELRHQPWVDRQVQKASRALALIEQAPPALTSPPDVGQIMLACALGYHDLRFAGTWRADHPRLVAWLDAFAAAVPAFEETRVKS